MDLIAQIIPTLKKKKKRKYKHTKYGKLVTMKAKYCGCASNKL